MIRRATPSDLDALVQLEEESFDEYRIARPSYRRLLRRSSAVVLVDECDGAIRGSAVLLFRRGLAVARLYSIAVSPHCRRKGIGQALVEAAIEEAVERDRLVLRLEVREDNQKAIGLYERLGFHYVDRVPDYYTDGTAALRYERATVEHHEPPQSLRIPYYPQTLDFTCGSACLMMAIKHFQPAMRLNRTLELDLWREATTIFMTSGIGGTSAEGLALAAINHGLSATIVTNDRRVPFINSVRSPEKKEVIELVHNVFRKRLKESGHKTVFRHFTKADVIRAVDENKVPILLVSGYRFYGEKIPHWVVVTGYDDHFIYIHDPWIPEDVPEFDGRHVPIHERDFTRINRYGRTGTRTMILISAPEEGPATADEGRAAVPATSEDRS